MFLHSRTCLANDQDALSPFSQHTESYAVQVRVKDVSGLIVLVSVEQHERLDLYDYSQELLNNCLLVLNNRIYTYFKPDPICDKLSCMIVMMFRGNKKLLSFGRFHIIPLCRAFLLLRPQYMHDTLEDDIVILLLDFFQFYGFLLPRNSVAIKICPTKDGGEAAILVPNDSKLLRILIEPDDYRYEFTEEIISEFVTAYTGLLDSCKDALAKGSFDDLLIGPLVNHAHTQVNTQSVTWSIRIRNHYRDKFDRLMVGPFPNNSIHFMWPIRRNHTMLFILI